MASQDRPRGGLGIHGVGLPGDSTGAPVAPVHFEHLVPGSPDRARESRPVAAGGRQVRPADRRVPLTWASVPDDYAEQIRALRRARGLSQAQLATLVGATRKAVVYQWEAWKRTPSPVGGVDENSNANVMGGLLPGRGRVIWRGRGSVGTHAVARLLGSNSSSLVVSRRRTTPMSTPNVARTAATRPCSPRGVPIPIR